MFSNLVLFNKLILKMWRRCAYSSE